MVDANRTAPASLRWRMLFGVWLLYACFGLTIAGLAPLVAPITRDLGMTHSEMGTVLGVWQLVYILAAVPCGALLDRIGVRKALFLGGLLIGASGLLRSLSSDFITLCLAVGIFGIGGPIISSGAPKVVSQWFQGRDRGFAMGVYITGPAIGSIVAFALTNSVLMPLFDEHWPRVLQLWAALCVLGAAVWLVVAGHGGARAAERAEADQPRPPQREVLRQLTRLPAVRLLLVMSIGIFMFNHGLNNWLPELLRADGMSATAAGYWATVPNVVGIAGSLMIPRLATPGRRLLILGTLAVFALAASLLLHFHSSPLLLAALILQGIARSSLMTVAVLTLVETPGVGERHAGTASGLFFSAAEVGGASGPIVLGVLYDATGGFAAGLGLLTGIALLLLVGVLRLQQLARRAGAVP
ncbi:MFS transporter [Desertibaculum subflavum]|uniref:MFS transporter n=1 Tax=Desertibaculum subflavum TaxID=2268458 RepID=UPI000E65FA01